MKVTDLTAGKKFHLNGRTVTFTEFYTPPFPVEGEVYGRYKEWHGFREYGGTFTALVDSEVEAD